MKWGALVANGWNVYIERMFTWKAPFSLPVPERPCLCSHFCCAILGSSFCMRSGCVDNVDSEDAAGGGNERDFAQGCRECGEEFLCKLGRHEKVGGCRYR